MTKHQIILFDRNRFNENSFLLCKKKVEALEKKFRAFGFTLYYD